MASASGSGPSGKTFLLKVHQLIETCPDDVVAWSEDGTSFYIKDADKFVTHLPKFFRHSNMKSFVRQLNLYGFHKLRNMGTLQKTDESVAASSGWKQFRHDRFIRGNHQLIQTIQRKQPHFGKARSSGIEVGPGGASGEPPPSQADLERRVDKLNAGIEKTVSGMHQLRDALGAVLEIAKQLPPPQQVAVQQLAIQAAARATQAQLPPPIEMTTSMPGGMAPRDMGGGYGKRTRVGPGPNSNTVSTAPSTGISFGSSMNQLSQQLSGSLSLAEGETFADMDSYDDAQ